MTTRRQITTALALAPLGAHRTASAAWPDKPVRLIVPSAAGGAPDVICRILGAELAKALGQTVLIDNKPSGSGNIAMQEIVRAPADGYTLGCGNVGKLSINLSLFDKLPYQPFTQLAPVALQGSVASVKELIALARSKPGRLTMGSAGNGTTSHLGGELFKSLTGTFIVHVPYRGSAQAINDLIGGQLDLMFDNLSSIGPHIRQGRVKALAVSGAQRSPAFAALPTVAEAGAPACAIYFAMSDADVDVDRILTHPLAMIGSDGMPAPGVQHPRLWGSFPRVLGHYARDRRLMALETAVHKMTGLTARPPSGIHWVLMNGRVAVQDGQTQDLHAGQLLRRAQD